MRFLSETKFIVPLLFGFILLFSLLLYKNLNKKSTVGENPTIGIIKLKNKKVLRKYDNQVVWDQIEISQEVRNRDTIRTEELSDAILELNDGTTINISENSMILLDLTEKSININFAYGSIEAARESVGKLDTKLNITSGDKTVEVSKGDIKLDKSKQELSIKVGEGEAKLIGNGINETIQKDQIASLTENQFKVSKLKFILNLPEDKKNFYSEMGQELVTFSISGLEKESINASSPSIEIANSPDFSQIVLREKIRNNTLKKNLNSGSYYWRIRYTDPESRNTDYTNAFRFRIIQDPPLRVIIPREFEKFHYVQDLPLVKVAWNDLDLYSNFNVQIATDPNFNSIIKSRQTQNFVQAFDDLQEGVYFLRVLAKSSNSEIPDKLSNISSFSVVRKLNLEPPELIDPFKDKMITRDQWRTGINFSWRDNKDYSQYQLEISKDISFSNPIIKEKLKSNFIKLNGDGLEGKYYWKVRGITDEKEISSAIFSFQVIAKEEIFLSSPSNNLEIESEDGIAVFLKWKGLSQKSDYQLEIYKGENIEPFQSIDLSNLGSYEFKTNQTGKFSWRVIARNSLGEKSISDKWVFFIQRSVDSPELLLPSKAEVIDLSNRNSIIFNWKSVENAMAYRIKVTDITTLKEKIIINERIIKNNYIFNDFKNIGLGKYRWEVATIYNKGNSEKESKPSYSDFSIVLPQLKIPEIFTPDKIYVE